ncbi:cytochrome oxidase small assembly protein [Ideonella sp.]
MAQLHDAQRRANRRLGWILASVALVFALGFIAKIALMGP